MSQQEDVLQFCPLVSAVEPSFWSILADRKLNDYKLSTEPIEISGYFSSAFTTFWLTSSSFNNNNSL
jgi:hypothetical protein